jgi:hypothetical protein
MTIRIAALLGVLALAGCGGDDAGSSGGAQVAPLATQLYVELDTNLESDQWEQVQALLDRFPRRPQIADLLDEHVLAEHELDYEEDVAPALGDTVVVVGLDVEDGDAVLLTQPEDDETFDALVRRFAEETDEDVVTGEVDGWRAAAENQAAIDALRNADDTLDDDDEFRQARDDAPDDRLAFAFARGDAAADLGRQFGQRVALDWASAYAEAREDGPAVGFSVHSDDFVAETYESSRIESAPADALAFLSFGADAIREQRSALAPLTQLLGIDVSGLLGGVRGEGALWVRAGSGGPEVTLVVESQDPDQAREALEDLLDRLPLPVRVGVVDGQIVATTASSPAAALQTSGDSLSDDEDFREAADVAGLPDETAGFLYLDVADALPFLGLLAGLGGDAVPDELLENARPIRSVLAWSETGEDESSQTLFLHIQ